MRDAKYHLRIGFETLHGESIPNGALRSGHTDRKVEMSITGSFQN